MDLGPDATGDGLADIVIGDPTDGTSRVYLHAGLGGPAVHTWAAADEGTIGDVVALGPDVDGDGLGDVGAGRRVSVGSPHPGDAYLWSGGSGALIRRWRPARGDCEAVGAAIDIGPDVDGDALGDVVITDPGRRDSGCEGVVSLFSGASGALLRTWRGPPGFGLDHVFLGLDGTGDGLPDVVAVDASSEGVRDAAGHIWLLSPLEEEPTAHWNGRRGDRLGRTAAFCRDTDGDGRADVVATSGWDEFDFEDPGAVDVVLASSRGGVRDVTRGYSVAAGEDLDADGIGDFAIGEPFGGEGGRVRLVSGRTGRTVRTLSGAALGPDVEIGHGVAMGPDADGDARADIAVRGFSAGRAVIYVFFSGN